MEKKEFKDEQNYLEQVERYIDKRINILEGKKDELRRDISVGRKDM
jgi:hypothetical protein